MLDSVYKIECDNDMQKVEQRMSELVHGEHGRCSWLNSAEYSKFRLQVLYKKPCATLYPKLSWNQFSLLFKDDHIYLFSDTSEEQIEDLIPQRKRKNSMD